MTIHLSSYFVYRHLFYINNVPTVGELSLLLNCFYVIQNSKQEPPTVVQTCFKYCFYFLYSNKLIWGAALLCGGNNSTISSFFVLRWLSIRNELGQPQIAPRVVNKDAHHQNAFCHSYLWHMLHRGRAYQNGYLNYFGRPALPAFGGKCTISIT